MKDARNVSVQIARYREESAQRRHEAEALEQQAADLEAAAQFDAEVATLTAEEEARLQAVGERIRLIREDRGLSQLDLANAVHATPKTVWNWENGATDIRRRGNLEPVAEALGVEKDWLLYGPEGRPSALADAITSDGSTVTLKDGVDMAMREIAQIAQRVEIGLKVVEDNNRMLREILALLKGESQNPLEQAIDQIATDEKTEAARQDLRARTGRPQRGSRGSRRND